jgi:U4/U6.U5 tri-snRNP component SNU23
MADSKQGAYATKAADTDFRRKWDKEEYAEKARKKDDEERERMQENEERMKQGTERLVYCTIYSQANYLGSIYH